MIYPNLSTNSRTINTGSATSTLADNLQRREQYYQPKNLGTGQFQNTTSPLDRNVHCSPYQQHSTSLHQQAAVIAQEAETLLNEPLPDVQVPLPIIPPCYNDLHNVHVDPYTGQRSTFDNAINLYTYCYNSLNTNTRLDPDTGLPTNTPYSIHGSTYYYRMCTHVDPNTSEPSASANGLPIDTYMRFLPESQRIVASINAFNDIDLSSIENISADVFYEMYYAAKTIQVWQNT